MGRTIHYTITADTMLTKKNLLAMKEISERYTSGTFENVWTCEAFWHDPYQYYPNWDNPHFFKKGERMPHDDIWELVETGIKKLCETMDYMDALKKMLADNLITCNTSTRRETGGFVKTQGNEFNSLLTYLALIEISIAVPKCEIAIYDEGEFLLCRVKLRKGKVTPDLDDMQADIKRYSSWVGIPTLQPKLDVKNIPESLLRDMGFNSSYGKDLAVKSINNKLRNLDLIYKRIKKQLGTSFVCTQNIQHLQYEPMLFTRTVDVENYKDYSDKTWDERMMDGFDGEGFGLTDEDPTLKTKEMLNHVTALLHQPEVRKLLKTDPDEELALVNGDGNLM